MEVNKMNLNEANKYSKNVIKGLTSREVRERVLRGEVNKLPKAPSRTIWQMIKANCFNIFTALNLVLGTLIIIAGSPKNALFALVIIINCVLGVYQELSARSTLEKLSVLSMAHVDVIRDGKKQNISIEDIVKDDILVLESGNQILADCTVIHSDELELDESMLTGEADPVYKNEEDKLFSGSFIVAGEGYARVTEVGKDTYSSKLAEEAREFKIENSELQDSISKIIKTLLWVIVPAGGLLAFTQFQIQDDWRQAIIGSVSGIVGMIPEGLVLLTSATFITSVIKLSKHHTLVQQLSATEILARVDTLCVDKTGTITEGKLNLVDVVSINNQDKQLTEDMVALLVNNLPSKNPTQNAILEKYTQAPDIRIIEKVPFSSKRKWGGIVVEDSAWVMGAPEILLKDRYSEYEEKIEEEASKGRRVLLFAKVPQKSLKHGITANIEECAIILIEDVIRKEAPDVIKYFEEEGVSLKVISGDNPVTVSAVAKRAGVDGADKYIDARKLPTNEEELRSVVDNYNVFGRVTPHQKKAIVKALKQNNHTVAMTGDGVNDVLALKEADCGIAMANGSEATKAVAQLVLMNSDFSSLPQVVAEGRRQIFNLERVAELFLSKTAFFVILAIVFCIIRIKYPLSPIQTSLVGSCAIGIPGLFLAMLPYKGRIQGGFFKRILLKSVPNGLVMGAATIMSYLLMCFRGYDYVYSSTMALTVFLGISLMILIKVSLPLTRFKVALVLSVIAISLACYFTPIGQEFFGIKVLALKHWMLALVLIFIAYPSVTWVMNRFSKVEDKVEDRLQHK